VVEVAGMKKSIQRKTVAAAVVLLLTLGPAVAHASQTRQAGSDFGIGVVTVLANLVYMPVKLVYGVLGGVTGSFAYVLSGANREVADGVWIPSLGGDYVLTTEMMSGREQVHFNGVRPRPGAARDDGRDSGADGSGSAF
jgi:hypothetical protein